MGKNEQQILVISSHVIRGSVGSRCSVNVLETMGFPVWSMLTVSMTWQPAHGPSHRLNVALQDFQAWADDILRSPWNKDIACVMTGYFVSPEQVHIAAALIRDLKKTNPSLIYFCDPVLGDEAGLYVKESVAHAVKEQLLPLADWLKPNRSELEWLCGRQLVSNAEIIKAAQSMNSDTVLVTSAWAEATNATGNLFITKDNILLVEHPRVEKPVTGLGDMTAALFLSFKLRGKPSEQALYDTTSAVYRLLRETIACNSYELKIEHMADAVRQVNRAVNLYRLETTSPYQATKVEQNDGISR